MLFINIHLYKKRSLNDVLVVRAESYQMALLDAPDVIYSWKEDGQK